MIREMACKLIEVMFYSLERKKRIMIPIISFLFFFLYILTSYICYFMVYIFVGDASVFLLKDAFIVVGCCLAIIFVMNVCSKRTNVFRLILEYNYLSTVAKNERKNDIFRIIISFPLLYAITVRIIPIMDKISDIMLMNTIEKNLMHCIVYLSTGYFFFTDIIIDHVRRYWTKIVASLCILFLLAMFYSEQLVNIDEKQIDAYGVIIFCLGLLSLFDTAISNYREMYQALKVENEKELEAYLCGVISKYDSYYANVKGEMSDAKECIRLFVILWKKMTLKRKVTCIIFSVVVLLLGIGIMIISNKIKI